MPVAGITASQIKLPEPPPPLPDWLPANTEDWYDAANEASIRYSGPNVHQWWPRVGDAELWIAGDYTGATWNTTQQNGLPVMTMNGSCYFIGQPYLKTYDTSNCAIIGVARTRSGGSPKTWFSVGGYSSGISLTHTGENSAGWGLLVGYVEWWLPAAAVPDLFHLQTVTVAGGVATLRSNGTVIGTKAIAPNPPIEQIYMGGDYNAVGSMTPCDVCEVLFINGAWTQAEIETVENEFRAKWGI